MIIRPSLFKTLWRCLLLLTLSSLSQAVDFGSTGLIDIPNARMESDGTLSTVASLDGRHRQFSISYQATPWLQGTFRYTGFDQFFYWDRNYEFKARLWEEELFLPAVALGVRDMVGTGVFGSEYLVATKGFGRTDVTLGIGWGRLAGKGQIDNPLTQLSERFEDRDASTGVGGRLSVDNFFSGPKAGLFGGLSHRLEKLPLTAVVEYNPDQYEFDVQRGGDKPSHPISFGLTWAALPGVNITASHQHGDEVGLAFQFSLGSLKEPVTRLDRDFISSFYLPQERLPSHISKNRWYSRLLHDVERSGLLLLEGSLSSNQQQAQLVVGNTSYAIWTDAIATFISLADLHLPATVRTIYFVVEDAGHRTVTLAVPRPSSSFAKESNRWLKNVRVLSGRTLEAPEFQTNFVTGVINTDLNLRTRFQLFDPDDPARYQVYVDISSEYALSNYWAIRSTLALNIDHNFDESSRKVSDSVLPKVRSDIVNYLTAGDSGLEKLIIEGRNTYGRSIHYRAFAGILEDMYSGLGGELLFWPTQSRVAVGLSLAYAKQRAFDRGLDHLDYDVITGHVSAYWATPFYNYDLAVHAGRYLAKDTGATVEVRRTFRNGWQVGTWATFTDVSFSDFGEGSFDKGFYFQIPLDAIFGGQSRSKLATLMRPIQRDGGQRLDGYSGNIFWDLRESRYDALSVDERMLP